MNVEKAIQWIELEEGGYVHNPADPGGATNYGITQRTYDAWRKSHGLAAKPVWTLTLPEASQIYREKYWVPAHCSDFPDGVDLVHMDVCVQRGDRRAIEMAQQLSGVDADGLWGPDTAQAIKTLQPLPYLNALKAHYLKQVEIRTASRVFIHGWRNRTISLARFINCTDFVWGEDE